MTTHAVIKSSFLFKLLMTPPLGSDGIIQEQLIMGSKVLSNPLTLITNKSIQTGTFPEAWKEAYVTPVLKKEIRD